MPYEPPKVPSVEKDWIDHASRDYKILTSIDEAFARAAIQFGLPAETDFTKPEHQRYLYGVQQYGEGGYEDRSTDQTVMLFLGPERGSEPNIPLIVSYHVDLPIRAAIQILTERNWSFEEVQRPTHNNFLNKTRYFLKRGKITPP